ncbi:MAG: VOC family protein [Microbacterium sp.]
MGDSARSWPRSPLLCGHRIRPRRPVSPAISSKRTTPPHGWLFVNVTIADGALLPFATPPIDFPPQHDADLLDDAHFDRARAKIVTSRREHWADPQRSRPDELDHEHGGRGVYLLDPSGHYLELITHPDL